jgi:predicted phage tail protein
MLNATEERPTKVLLHGPLGDMFGREHSLYVSSPGEAIRALCVLREGFRDELSRPGAFYTVLAGETALPLEALNIGTARRDIHIVPVVEGAKSDNAAAGWSILAATALIVVGYALSGYTGGGSLVLTKVGSAMLAAGISMGIGGVISLLSSSDTGDKPKEQSANNPSRLFSGAVNTIAQGHPIQICYGEVEIGSALISTMMDHDASAGSRYFGLFGGNGFGVHYKKQISNVDSHWQGI